MNSDFGPEQLKDRVSGAGLDKGIKSSVLDLSSLRHLRDIQIDSWIDEFGVWPRGLG